MTLAQFESLPIGTRVKLSFVYEQLGTVIYNSPEKRGVQWDEGTIEYLEKLTQREAWLACLSVVTPEPKPRKKKVPPTPKVYTSEKIDEMIDGMRVSKDTHCYHLIPQIAMQRLCERISLGEQTKGKDAWNAMSENQSVLDSRKALARRFGHLINHSYRLLGKIETGEEWTEDDEREASAVMWGGMFAICAIAAQRKKQEK